LVNAERFTTPELAEYENKVLSAESEAYELEYQMFQELRTEVMGFAGKLQVAAQAVAEIDALLTLTKTALRWRWICPNVLENSKVLKIRNGRHPVVEKISIERFIANNLNMENGENPAKFWLITGPNMSGKSTFLRQNAIIILLAQIGSFVPAEKCELGIVDRIFTRVGASDNLAAGKSTFFVEMAEMAHILNAATDKSFIILDEIGRGTSTFDGISIAWAITEFLHNKIKAKTIFATHYHELIDCVDNLNFAENYHVSVAQNNEEIIFLRKIKKGGISDSFGIEVAASTGFPKEVILKSREILEKLESENIDNAQPNLFSAPKIREKIVKMKLESAVEKLLLEINPDKLSPLEALEKVYELKKNLKKQ
jgi:DNA mismatch repair protein MutS